SLVPVTPVRILDTRIDAGLVDAFVSDVPRQLRVTGEIEVVGAGNTITRAPVVPTDATALVANVTAVAATAIGYVSVRPGGVTGLPTTSSVNIAAPGGV